jgi:hypothetical protein
MSNSTHARCKEQTLDAQALEAFLVSETTDPGFDEPLRTKPADRRLYKRLSPEHCRWLQAVRQKYGAEVHLVDLSLGGMLIETIDALEPQCKVVFELVGSDSTILAPARVLRCHKAVGATRYRCAISFARPLTLPAPNAPPTSVTSIAGASASARPATAPMAARTAAAPRVQPAARAPEAAAAGPAVFGGAWQKVVARYADGTVVRGYTSNFHTSRSHLHLSDHPTASKPMIVPLEKLKAIFFVRNFEGDPTYAEQKAFVGAALGRKIEVSFHDGETLTGTTMSYQYQGNGFFLQPADPTSNNLRVFVLMAAVRQVRFLS